MSRVPTLEDVARAAGVSRATASRVVRGDVNVHGEKVLAVEGAIKSLGYVPNTSARSLATRSTDAIALIVPEPDARVFADPFFGTAVAAVSSRLADSDKQLLLVLSGGPGGPERLRRFIRARHADGLVVMSHHDGGTWAQILSDADAPVVFIGRPPTGVDALFVDVDNVEGGRVAARRLMARGRHRLAVITGALDMPAGRDRLEGFCEELAVHGIGPVTTEIGDFTATSGEAAAERLLASGLDIDGIFAGNDLTAIGALRRLTRAGIDVPDDIALIGFDDIAIARESINDLTTIANPATELSTLATSMLLDLLGGARPESIVLQDLVLRERGTG